VIRTVLRRRETRVAAKLGGGTEKKGLVTLSQRKSVGEAFKKQQGRVGGAGIKRNRGWATEKTVFSRAKRKKEERGQIQNTIKRFSEKKWKRGGSPGGR